jgi:hypothetical protein
VRTDDLVDVRRPQLAHRANVAEVGLLRGTPGIPRSNGHTP